MKMRRYRPSRRFYLSPEVAALAARPYTAIIERIPQGYLAIFPDLPGCSTWATTWEDLPRMMEDAKATWIEGALRRGQSIPEPRSWQTPQEMPALAAD